MVEQYTRIPYREIGFTKGTTSQIIDYTIYENKMYYTEQGSTRIKRIDLPDYSDL